MQFFKGIDDGFYFFQNQPFILGITKTFKPMQFVVIFKHCIDIFYIFELKKLFINISTDKKQFDFFVLKICIDRIC